MRPALALPVLLIAGTASAAIMTPPYRAQGHRPDWSLSIDRGVIRYIGDHGRSRISVRAPTPRPSFNGERYATPRITVDVTHAVCRDAVDRRTYRDTVTVAIGRRTVRGCGGPVAVTAVGLDGTRWRIATLDGQPVRTARATEVRFDGGRVSGNAGCNSFGGDYRVERRTFSAGPLISTKMACSGLNGGAAIETRVFAILRGPDRLDRAGDTLTLTGPAGRLELRAAP